jgi:predicted nucleotidyltransferase component of viral defense system
MIPLAYIQEWSEKVPWQEPDMVEQDLIICRSLVEIYNDSYLSENLAFRGGTAIHKLFLNPQPRYSVDIDLVQIEAKPIKETIARLQKCMSYLGKAVIKQKANNNTIVFKFTSETLPDTPLRLKIEINCREHFSILGYIEKDFEVDSSWFKGHCRIKTYQTDEMLGTKLRALYQRRKGRDLYDLHKGLTSIATNTTELLRCYSEYMKFSVGKPPSRKLFHKNMEEKIRDPEFLGDTRALLRPDDKYNAESAWERVKNDLIDSM